MNAKLLDRVLEAPIAPSFTRIGAVIRSRTESWTDLDDYDLSGRTVLLTGATSGLGLAAAHRLAGLGDLQDVPAVSDRADDLHGVELLPGDAAREDLPQHDPVAVHVRRLGERLAAQHLRGHPLRGARAAHLRPHHHRLQLDAAETEVADFDISIRVQINVTWLEVAMDNTY